jgi:hypothetical protein
MLNECGLPRETVYHVGRKRQIEADEARAGRDRALGQH